MSINSRGFTLVEVLIISPIIILFIGAFLALLISLTGESLVVREKNTAAYNTQSALDDIEASVTQAVAFLPTTGTVPIPQGKDNSTSVGTPFTNETTGEPNALIIRSAATTSNPHDPARELIYMGAGTCDPKNPLYTYYTVYFTALDPDTAGDTTDRALYKRTILPQSPSCKVAWQRGSCDVSRMTSHPSVCKARDEKLVSGITTFDVQYYIGSSTTAIADSQAASATDVSVNMALSKQVAGSTVQYSGNVRTNSLNVQTSENVSGSVTSPTLPPIEWSRSTTEPYRTTISWGRVGSATSYVAKYRLAGGSEVTVPVSQPGGTTSPSFPIDAAHRKQTVQLTSLEVVSANGQYPYDSPMPTISAIPNWNDCQFSGQGSWNNYGSPAWYNSTTFTTAGFTRTSSGIVGLKGLVKGTTLNVPICTLPVGFRPKFPVERLIFQTAACCSNWGRIDILANGDVVPIQGNTEWFSLDGIMFMSDTSNTTWTNRSWLNGWSQYPSPHTTLRSTTDSQGRIHVQGLGLYSGTAPNSVLMMSGLAGSSGTLHYPAMSSGPGIVQVRTDGGIQTRSSPSSYQQIQVIYRPSGASGWLNMPFYNSWTNYLNGFPTMQCHKGTDDVVIVQGLVRHPSDGNGVYMGDTVPCGRFNSGKPQGTEDRLILSPWTSNEAPGRIDLVNGVSLLSQGTAAGWTALDGIHYIAD